MSNQLTQYDYNLLEFCIGSVLTEVSRGQHVTDALPGAIGHLKELLASENPTSTLERWEAELKAIRDI